MHAINTRGTFACSQACIPCLKKSLNSHILMSSPPLSLEPRWFGHFCIDDEVLRRAGVTDFEPYQLVPGAKLIPDYFL